MDQIVGQTATLGWVALKAALLFATAVVGFRLSERRTLAQMTGFDFVAAIAVGAILGRVPNSSTTSYLQGAVTLITILVAHAVVTRLRFLRGFTRLVDHRPRLLVVDGRLQRHQLRRCGLTDGDVFALLREQGVGHLSQVRYLIFEQRGRVSLVRTGGEARDPSGDSGDLVAYALREAPPVA